MNHPNETETYSEAETEARAAATLARMLATPPKKQKDTKSSGLLKRGRPRDGRKSKNSRRDQLRA